MGIIQDLNEPNSVFTAHFFSFIKGIQGAQNKGIMFSWITSRSM